MVAANGLPQLLVRFIPAHESRGERHRALRLSGVCIVAASVALVLLGLVVRSQGSFFFAFAAPATFSSELFLWFYATTIGVMLKQVVYGGLNGLRRLTVQVAVELVTLLAALVWIALYRHTLSILLLFKILGYVHLLTAGGGLLAYFALLVATPSTAEDEAEASSSYVREYGPYLIWAAGLGVVALAFTDVDRYLLSQVLALEVLALFHIAARISRLANRLLGVSNLAFQPEITRLDSEQRTANVVVSTRIFLKFNTVISILMMFFIAFFAREIIVLVANDRYVPAVRLLMVFALALPLTTMTAPITTVMKALDQVRGALIVDLVWAVTYVVLILVLGRPFQLMGVAAAHLGACALQLLVAVRISNLPLGLSFLGSLMLRLLFSGAVSFLPLAAADVLFGGTTVVSLGLKVLLFVFGCLLFRGMVRAMKIFAKEEKATLLRTLKKQRAGVFAKVL